ncbi:MAG: PASTA domain-containing protein [bacterium]|nr:PASTA domain-containing protein [bacterium]
MKRLVLIGLLAGLLLLIMPVGAQQAENVTVPNVTGLNVPQAAAALNRVGLRLGTETAFGWTADSPFPQNSVSAQSVAPGTSVAYGTTVDLTVLRSANALLIYDDNDITLVNQTGAPVSLAGIQFATLDGASQAGFAAARWSPTLAPGDCGQLWSVGRSTPKELPECAEEMRWITTGNSAEHFWTGAGGTTQFAVFQDGVQRATCPVSATGRCELFLASGGAGDATEFIYFAYTTDRLIIYNRSADRWMPLMGVLINVAATPGGAPIAPVTETDNPQAVLGDVMRLAPGQCLYVRVPPLNGEDTPPEPCDLLASYTLTTQEHFWARDFFITSVTDGEQRTCPAAQPGRLSLCILPR